jgi:hypothetical protein
MKKKWKDMTEQEINQLKRKQCSSCAYFMSIKRGATLAMCNYIELTGSSRGCSPLECKEKGKYKAKAGRRKKDGKE